MAIDKSDRKAMIAEYKMRKPEKGVISFRCKATGESFLGISNDTKADFNSNRAKLSMGNHPNKHFMELWNQYGEDGFEQTVLQVLKYDDPTADYSDKLEKMRDEYLAADSKASKIWK